MSTYRRAALGASLAGAATLARGSCACRTRSKALGAVYAQTGMVPESSTPAKLAAMIKSDSEIWTPRIKEMGFQPIE